MKTIKEWSAKRSGASITITGEDGESGDKVVITNVTEITSVETGADGTSTVVAFIMGGDRAILA